MKTDRPSQWMNERKLGQTGQSRSRAWMDEEEGRQDHGKSGTVTGTGVDEGSEVHP